MATDKQNEEIKFRISGKEKKRYQRLADALGLKLSAMTRGALEGYAENKELKTKPS